MDKSREYLRMCERAEEIQQLRAEDERYTVGDLVYHGGTIYTSTANSKRLPDDDIWIPRQDQLQDLIVNSQKFQRFTESERFHWLIKFFLGYCERYKKYQMEEPSFEKIWLLYAMFVCFDKKWNPVINTWVKEEVKPKN